jgi:Fe-S-cluster containining protein
MIFDTSRLAFRAPRVICDCEECRAPCRVIPGYLVPEDLERLIPGNSKEAKPPLAWCEEHLRASPGALIHSLVTNEVIRVPTLVPARKADGSCHWLDKEERCMVHANSPFGCSFFLVCTPLDRDHGLAHAGIRAVILAWREQPQSLYAEVWNHLNDRQLVAPPAEEGWAILKNR